MLESNPPIRVAVIDLYDNQANQGMRAIRELLTAANGRYFDQPVTFEVFETRYKNEAPSLDFDVYVSSGGPGSPFDGEGKAWETSYFSWLDAVWNHNATHPAEARKHVFFICHSYQMMVRFFGLGDVVKRRSESFGIFPVHMTPQGMDDPLFDQLPDPFYAADFRQWQVIQPNWRRLDELGAHILALEKIRPYVALERATMAIRITDELVGTQFHPEADPPGMHLHFTQAKRRADIIRKHGEEKYNRIVHRLTDPDYLTRTHDAVLPNFLRGAIAALRPEAALVIG